MYYKRILEPKIIKSIANFPITAILGPRQCGKSTMAKQILSSIDHSIYLDLEKPSDLSKLDNPEWFLSSNRGKLICIDEIQRKPEIFPIIRSLVDDWRGNGHFLILGSASQDLIKQSSESLAGRISYHRLTPFLFIETQDQFSLEDYIIKGGFPGSLCTNSKDISDEWLENFSTTFIERDILQWKGIMPQALRRLWQMLAHNNGQVINLSLLGNSLNVSHQTVKNYIDLLYGTFMLHIIPPYVPNINKRIIKTPEIYLNDSGIICSFAGIKSFNQLSGHILLGTVWESVVLQNLQAYFQNIGFYFYRTAQGAEIDFILEYAGKTLAVECKASLSPKLSKGNYISLEDVSSEKLLVVTPIEKGYEKNENTTIASLNEALFFIEKYFDL
jgi:predicted AAA+ superfamily ATPase